jgi:hypothetical protein
MHNTNTYTLDTQIPLSPIIDRIYYISSAHRNLVTADKSKWTISVNKEVECFIEGQTSEWIEDNFSWGLKFNGNALEEIGVNTQNQVLKIAKFIDSSNNNIWHGYPADYIRKQQDRPSIAILSKWRERNIISKHHIVKIRQGKSCNL